ncbi:hypothetical protein [Okeania sp. SIO1I7]|nr:hypothetical protein [Okeania sp. SIO1I7]
MVCEYSDRFYMNNIDTVDGAGKFGDRYLFLRVLPRMMIFLCFGV